MRREVFKGQDAKGVHRTGSEGAAMAILGYATIACAAYLFDTGLFTGTLLGKHRIPISVSIIFRLLYQHSTLHSTSNKCDWPESYCVGGLLSRSLISCILCVIMRATCHVVCLAAPLSPWKVQSFVPYSFLKVQFSCCFGLLPLCATSLPVNSESSNAPGVCNELSSAPAALQQVFQHMPFGALQAWLVLG